MEWATINEELNNLLRLKTDPIAYRRLEKEEDLSKIKNVFRVPHGFFFCQALFMARAMGLTIGITKEDKLSDRCMRIHGVQAASEENMKGESMMMATTWFKNPDEAYQQMVYLNAK
jgi:uncharacterized protein (DUF169 family)